MLTERQRKVLMFIDAHTRDVGRSPGFREIAAHMGLKSQAGVHQAVKGLVDRQFLARGRPNTGNNMIVLRLPPGSGTPFNAEILTAADTIRRAIAAGLDMGPTTPGDRASMEQAAAFMEDAVDFRTTMGILDGAARTMKPDAPIGSEG